MRSWSGGGSQQTGLFTHPRNESNGWKPRRNLIRRMTTLGRQRGEACLLESWQTQKIRGEAEVRSTQRSSLSQTVVWLAITSVLLTQSIIPVGAIRGQFPSASSSLSNGAVMLEARGGVCFLWNPCPDWGCQSVSSQGDLLQSSTVPGRYAVITEDFKEPSQRSENMAP